MADPTPEKGFFSRWLDGWWPKASPSLCDECGDHRVGEGLNARQRTSQHIRERVCIAFRWLDGSVGWLSTVPKKTRGGLNFLHDRWWPKPVTHRISDDGHQGLSEGWQTLKKRWPHHNKCMRKIMRWLDISLRIFASLFLLNLLFNVFEPFGLGNATKAHSQRIAARALSPFYGSPAQDNIAVVLIDDQTLKTRDMGWPPQYSYYDELMRRILAQQPRAVYVDILMEQRRSYDSTYEDARVGLADEIKAAGVPVFFGVSAPGARSIFSGLGYRFSHDAVDEANVVATPSALTSGVALDVVTSWQGTGTAYPLLLAAENVNPTGGWSPPLSTGPGVGADYRSVALALYQAVCVNTKSPGCVEPAHDLSAMVLATPMAVQWGVTNPVMVDAPAALDCVRESPVGKWERLRTSLSLFVDSLFSGMDSQRENRNRARCPYTLTLFEDQLDDEALGEVLKDRVVLVGTRLVGLNDSVLSPVHQQIPGVYLHAMALDNLMTWGSDRVHLDPGLGRQMGFVSALLFSLAVGLVFMLTESRWPRVAWVVVVAFLVSMGMVILIQWCYRQPPQDWIGTLVVVGGVAMYAWRRDVKRNRNSQPKKERS